MTLSNEINWYWWSTCKLDHQKSIFGNPTPIVSDRGAAFTFNRPKDYYSKENIQHVTITIVLPRENCQVEHLNIVIISILVKLSVEIHTKWYLRVSDVQQVINSTYNRSINTTPFRTYVSNENAALMWSENIRPHKCWNSVWFYKSSWRPPKEAKKYIVKVQQNLQVASSPCY